MGQSLVDGMAAGVTKFRAWFGDLNFAGKLFIGCWGTTIFLCVLPYLFILRLSALFSIDNSSELAEAPKLAATDPIDTPTSTTIPTATEVPFSGADYEGGECITSIPPIEEALVVEVIDGDTIVVEVDGEQSQVRYIGMDTPEKNQQYGDRALTANRSLVLGKIVFMVKDESELDSFDRLLRYVFTENTFVNYQLVSIGYATAKSYPPDISCDLAFLIAEDEARLASLGMWRVTVTPRPPTPAPIIPSATSSSGGGGGDSDDGGNCHPSYPSVCLAPNIGDYDCAGGSGNGPNYVRGPIRVLPPDPFRLDGDNDGIGCE